MKEERGYGYYNIEEEEWAVATQLAVSKYRRFGYNNSEEQECP